MNDTANLSTIESRLRKLERQNRFLVTSLASVICVGVFTAAKSPIVPATFSEVKASRIVLVNDRGREVGTWTTEGDGYPALRMKRDYFGDSVGLYQSQHGCFLTLNDFSGAKVQLTSADVGSIFHLKGPSGGGRVHLTAAKGASIDLVDSKEAQIRLGAGEYRPLAIRRNRWSEPHVFITDGSLNLNGLDLRLNRADGKPILVLPQQAPRQPTENSAKNPTPRPGPRR